LKLGSEFHKFKMVAAAILKFGHCFFRIPTCHKSKSKHFYQIWPSLSMENKWHVEIHDVELHLENTLPAEF